MSKNDKPTPWRTSGRMITKHVTIAQAKATDTDDGRGGFSGYGSVFGNVDLGGDVVVRGAFAKHLDAFVRDGFIAEGHDWQGLGIGYPTKAVEDEYGLLFDMEYHGDDKSQAIRRKVNERIAAGKSVGLSIGYYVHDAEYEERKDGLVLLLKEIELREVSVVTVPMNPAAAVASAKGAVSLAEEGGIVHGSLAAYFARLKAREEFRMLKESRELSAANVRFIREQGNIARKASSELATLADELEQFANERDKDGNKSAANALAAERERFAFLTHGAGIGSNS